LESGGDGDELLDDGAESFGVIAPVEDRTKVKVDETKVTRGKVKVISAHRSGEAGEEKEGIENEREAGLTSCL
jgi:hypothetical protein